MSNKAKIRKDAMSLNPIDDALFCKMAEDIRFCEEILQVILSDKNLVVLSNVPQFVAKNMQGRSCTLDLKCTLGNGKFVNVEIQRADDDNHQKRVLYNSALLITNIMNPGIKFEQVPDVIVVFISAFDIFNQGKTVYHIERTIKETGNIVTNGMEEIYINAAIDDKSDIADLMKVFTENDTYDDDKFPITSSSKRRFKTTEEGVKEMCEVIEKNREEAVKEAKEEMALDMMADNEPVNKILKHSKLALSRIQELASQNGYTLVTE